MTQSTTHSASGTPLPSPKERRRLREAKSMSEQEVAIALGVTKATVRAWETGRSDPRGRRREAYLKLLAPSGESATADVDTGSAPAVAGGESAQGPSAAVAAVALAGGATGASSPDGAALDTADPVPTNPVEAAPLAQTSRPSPARSVAKEPRSVAKEHGEDRHEGASYGDASGPKPPQAQAAQAPKPARGKQQHDTTRPVPAVKRAARPAPPHPASPALPVVHPAPPVPPTPPTEPPVPAAALDVSAGSVSAESAKAAEPVEPVEATAPAGESAAGAAQPDEDQEGEPQESAWPHWSPRDSLPDSTCGPTPAEAFDDLYTRAAPDLVRQAFLLTGRRTLAHESVERAFHLAWQHWPEVATDRDPIGWVRAAAYEYAMSPWQRLRPGYRDPDTPPLEPKWRELLDALLELPPAYRRTLLLYDGLRLDLPEAAAETEASTPAAANRVLHAREAIAARLPQLGSEEALHEQLIALADACPAPQPTPAAVVRRNSERHVWFWTRTALTVTTLLIGITGLTAATAPTQYQPTIAPGRQVQGIPAHAGPQQLSERSKELRERLLSDPAHGPGRLMPQTR
ncbi:sigma factor-like helix-turn-helix DNA-binding protein [Streptomyces sp. NPDC059076]|uniref:sigma factor-like helix-turn-helix DNA-binding protein n=1 Tax=unclassified Streptomyces TaxID=2593676 RepID=UPI0036846865